MGFSEEDKHVVKSLRQNKRYSSRTLLKMFPNKAWTRGGLYKFIRKIDPTGSSACQPGSGHRRTARISIQVKQVEELTLSQEDAPHMHSIRREIARQVGVSAASVNRIIKKDLRLKCFKRRRAHELTENKLARYERCRRLLKRYPASLVNFIWFNRREVVQCCIAKQRTERSFICCNWDLQERDSGQPPTAHSANVQQIVDGLGQNISTASYRYARS